MNRTVPIALAAVAVVVLVVAGVFVGRGLFSTGAADEPAAVVAGDDASAPAEAEQPLTYEEVATSSVAAFQAWREGPIAARAAKLDEKVEGVPLMTYGSMLVFWTGSKQSGQGDAESLESLAENHLRPTIIPIYQQIAADGEAIATALRSVAPPDEVTADYERVLQCVDYEVGRSRYVVAVLSGESVEIFPEQKPNPCDGVETSVQALADSVAQ